ncbi:PRTRC system ParB family protein [Thiolapillus sp.]|uniref:PRTRC system ParB family protein n=3 Tax=Thiolapillus sp. TaxID=2017437 RepID=UPI003AF7966B
MNTAETLPAPFDLAAVMANLQNEQFLHVPVALLQVKEGFNHRRYFDEAALNDLAEDIRRNRIAQPLVIRPNEDKTVFYIIAGERRYRAAQIAGLTNVPCIVRLVSEAEAYAISVSENAQREDVSAAEQAVIAHRAVGLSDGDREEACRLLGWSRKKLNARLLLLHCDKSVLSAVAERKISIGHAELLAGLPKELQAQTLPSLIDKGVTVAQLKEHLGRYAYRIDSAAFDTADCAKCQHNSAQGNDLFGESIGDGRCLNQSCFNEKTAQWIEAKKAEAADEYGVVYLETEKPADQRVYLVRDGLKGVGREQYATCQSCARYGALMLTEKGREGKLETGVCFDPACNQEKVNAHQASLTEEKPRTAKEAGGKAPKATTRKKKASAPAVSGKLTAYATSLHHRAAAGEVPSDPHLVKVLGLLALIKEAGMPDLDPEYDELKLKSRVSDRAKLMAVLLAQDDMFLDELQTRAAALLVSKNHSAYGESDYLGLAKQTLRHHDGSLPKYFSMNKDYLAMLTIGGIKAVLGDSGFDQWYDKENGKDSIAKFIKGKKKADLIQAVLDAGFDWKGFVPKLLCA